MVKISRYTKEFDVRGEEKMKRKVAYIIPDTPFRF